MLHYFITDDSLQINILQNLRKNFQGRKNSIYSLLLSDNLASMFVFSKDNFLSYWNQRFSVVDCIKNWVFISHTRQFRQLLKRFELLDFRTFYFSYEFKSESS